MTDLNTPVNIEEELADLLGNEPHVLQLPNSIEGVTKELWKLRRFTVQVIAVRRKRVPPDEVTDEMWKRLAAFLAALYNLEIIDPKMK